MKTQAAIQQIKDQWKESVLSEIDFLNERTLEVSRDGLKDILSFLKNQGEYRVLMDLTGVDYLKPVKHTQVVYWLHQPENYERIRIIVRVERDISLPSVINLWAGADWYERELFDLFGVHFEGHPDLKRILMPDDWKGHPLRRDYPLTEERVQFKHEVEPKQPSNIIHVKRNQKFY